MDGTTKKCLQVNACKIRKGIIEGVYNAKSGAQCPFERTNLSLSGSSGSEEFTFIFSK